QSETRLAPDRKALRRSRRFGLLSHGACHGVSVLTLDIRNSLFDIRNSVTKANVEYRTRNFECRSNRQATAEVALRSGSARWMGSLREGRFQKRGRCQRASSGRQRL